MCPNGHGWDRLRRVPDPGLRPGTDCGRVVRVLELSLDECYNTTSWFARDAAPIKSECYDFWDSVFYPFQWYLGDKMGAWGFTLNDDYAKLIGNVEFGNVRGGRSAKLFYRDIHVATLNRKSNLNYVADRLISIHHLHTLFP